MLLLLLFRYLSEAPLASPELCSPMPIRPQVIPTSAAPLGNYIISSPETSATTGTLHFADAYPK